MNKQLLTRPFEAHQIKQRPGQHGKMLSYVDVAAVIARLNEGCDAWSFEVVSHQIQQDEVIVVGKLTADGCVKVAFGGSTITTDRNGQVVSLADDHKAAASDALKKAASLLGVGLELYGGQANASDNHNHTNDNYNQPADRPRAPAPADRLTTRQLAAIHAVSRKQGLSRDGLAALLRDLSGKDDAARLTRSEASAVISQLTGANGGAA